MDSGVGCIDVEWEGDSVGRCVRMGFVGMVQKVADSSWVVVVGLGNMVAGIVVWFGGKGDGGCVVAGCTIGKELYV